MKCKILYSFIVLCLWHLSVLGQTAQPAQIDTIRNRTVYMDNFDALFFKVSDEYLMRKKIEKLPMPKS